MSSVKIKDITNYLETLAPRSLQEDYDNSGLLTGSQQAIVTGILVTLDCTEVVVDEAITQKCNLIVAHHPIIFKGLKKLTGANYIERTVIKAIKNDIAIYALHTNLDNVHTGVNRKIGERLGIRKSRILKPRTDTLLKLVTFIPEQSKGAVLDAMFAAGAGNIGNYENCSFQILGEGTFQPNDLAKPHIGKANALEIVNEVRVEVLLVEHRKEQVLNALRKSHPYEEVAYYLNRLENEHQEIGAGRIGELESAMEPIAFLNHLKSVMNTPCVRHTAIGSTPIQIVAWCGGSGSFLLPDAKAAGADIFITGDFKYHEFFDADGKIIIADIGHYESEQFTKDLIVEVLSEKFTTFAIIFSKSVTNPISYL